MRSTTSDRVAWSALRVDKAPSSAVIDRWKTMSITRAWRVGSCPARARSNAGDGGSIAEHRSPLRCWNAIVSGARSPPGPGWVIRRTRGRVVKRGASRNRAAELSCVVNQTPGGPDEETRGSARKAGTQIPRRRPARQARNAVGRSACDARSCPDSAKGRGPAEGPRCQACSLKRRSQTQGHAATWKQGASRRQIAF